MFGRPILTNKAQETQPVTFNSRTLLYSPTNELELYFCVKSSPEPEQILKKPYSCSLVQNLKETLKNQTEKSF